AWIATRFHEGAAGIGEVAPELGVRGWVLEEGAESSVLLLDGGARPLRDDGVQGAAEGGVRGAGGLEGQHGVGEGGHGWCGSVGTLAVDDTARIAFDRDRRGWNSCPRQARRRARGGNLPPGMWYSTIMRERSSSRFFGSSEALRRMIAGQELAA